MLCSIDGCDKPLKCKGLCEAHYRRLRIHGNASYGGPLKRQGSLCAVEDCNTPSRRNGFCAKHAYLFKVNGDPLVRKHMHGDAQSYYRNTVIQYDGDDCIIWPFHKDADGYGLIWRNGRNVKVHRAICEDVHSPSPFVDRLAIHSCGNGHLGCCSRRHVSWGSAQDNADDREDHGRTRRGEDAGPAKLSDQDVLEIRILAASSSQEEIAKRFGVTQGTISHILTGKTWRHI